jgi:hypothetical protein
MGIGYSTHPFHSMDDKELSMEHAQAPALAGSQGSERRGAWEGASDHVLKRFLWLYGVYALLNNGFYLFGYYLLPEGFMRSSPQVAAGRLAARPESFWGELAVTLFFNLGWMAVLAFVLNLNQVNGFPTGYILPFTLGITTGLIAGTNSFAASDLTQYNAWEGMALGLSIGGLEMAAYILILAATANMAIYQYRSWWRWSGEYKAVKIRSFRELRLTRGEKVALLLGMALLLLAALRETMMV